MTLTELQAEFAAHMDACTICQSLFFKRCWVLRDICKKLTDAGLFSPAALAFDPDDFVSRRIPTERELIKKNEIPILTMYRKAKKVTERNKKKG